MDYWLVEKREDDDKDPRGYRWFAHYGCSSREEAQETAYLVSGEDDWLAVLDTVRLRKVDEPRGIDWCKED